MQLLTLGKNHKTREIFSAIYEQIFKRFYWNLPSLIPLPRTPRHIDIELTNRCNLSCPHCHGRRQQRPIGDMNQALFKKLIDEINTYPFCHLHLCGLGEPALHPNFSVYLDYLKPLNAKVYITTNGHLLDRFDHEQILDWNIDLISISVDGFDSNTYQKHRPGGNYERLLKNVENFHKARSKKKRRYPIIRIANVLFPDSMNYSNISFFKKNWIRISDIVAFTSLSPIERPTYEVFNQCSETFFSINIRWDGRVPICGYYSNQFISSTYDSSIKEIFTCKDKKDVQIYQLRKEFDKLSFCKTCFYCQDKTQTALIHANTLHKNKLLTACNILYRKLNIGKR